VFPHAATDSIRHVYKTAHVYVCVCACLCGRGYILLLCVNVERRLGLLNLGKECRLVYEQ